MRRQYFWWTFLVGGIVFTAYGGYTLIYHFRQGNGLHVLSLIMLILGIVCLLLYLSLFLWTYFRKKKAAKTVAIEPTSSDKTAEMAPEPIEEPKKEEAKPEPLPKKEDDVEVVIPPHPDRTRSATRPRPSSRFDGGDAYVKRVGYGMVLRVNGERILDMRSNTYYRIQGNIVYQEGSGPAFEINGNRIRAAYGSYLYEISGSNINKVFGGFFASISGNYITTYDLSDKYELTDSLNRQQLLAVAALLFGSY